MNIIWKLLRVAALVAGSSVQGELGPACEFRA